MKLKKGDQIKIISGNDKGKKGKIIAVFPAEGKIVVEGLNMKKKHVRPKQQGKKGELVRLPVPFQASRAALVCTKCGKATRIGYSSGSAGKTRTCKKCGGEV